MNAVDATPEFIDVAGRRIRHVILRGSGDAVILVHGIGGNLGVWLMNLAALAASGRIVAAIDLPGHGESTKSLASGSLEELSGSVLDYLDAIGAERAHLVGHSMGAAVCLDAARRKPERVMSLALLNPAGLGSPPNLELAGRYVNAGDAENLAAALKLQVADASLITPQVVEDVLRYKSLDGAIEAQARILNTVFKGGDVDASLRRVVDQIPTLVIWGGRDVIIPPLEPAAFDGTKVAYHLLAEYGHLLPLEAAAEVNRLIDGFLG